MGFPSRQLPLMGAIRNPNKHLHMFQIALGILAAFGLDGAIRAVKAGDRRGLRVVLGGAVLLGVAAIGMFVGVAAIKSATGVIQQRFADGGWGQQAPVIVGQMVTIWSRARTPARDAGVPSMGETTSMKPSLLLVISMPSPWNSPFVSTCIS